MNGYFIDIMIRKKNRAQTTLEYLIMLSAIIGTMVLFAGRDPNGLPDGIEEYMENTTGMMGNVMAPSLAVADGAIDNMADVYQCWRIYHDCLNAPENRLLGCMADEGTFVSCARDKREAREDCRDAYIACVTN